ncbi:MAG: hypothetical protein U1D55_17135 [Phycisphaerae bacterium]
MISARSLSLISSLLGLAAALAQSPAALRLTVGGDGMLRGIRDVPLGVERLRTPRPLCTASLGDREFAATAMSGTDGPMRIAFGDSGVRCAIGVEAKPDYAILRVEQADERIDALRILDLELAEPDQILANRIFVFRNRCLGVIAGSPEIELMIDPAKRVVRATAQSRLPGSTEGLRHAAVAIFACEMPRLNEVISDIEREFEIPIGIRGKLDAANRRSYLFATEYDAASLDALIRFARDGGFGSILLLEDNWPEYLRGQGRRLGGNVEKLREAIDRIHAAGLRAGMHVKTTVISKQDRRVAPTPDPRLATHGTLTLAKEISASADFIELRESPSGWPRQVGHRDARIGDEILSYAELSDKPPYGLRGCQRGQYGTRAAAHAAGQPVAGLRADFVGALFVVDPATPMQDELSGELARVYDGAAFDWVYFDHAEDTPPPLWYNATLGQLSMLRQLRRTPAIVQASTETMFSWHFTTRTGQRDYFKLSMDARDEIDDALARSVPRAREDLMSPEIGWFPLRLPTDRLPGTSIADIEYLYTKALAADAAVSMQATPAACERLPHRAAILALMRSMEQLRLEGYFPREVREPLSAPRSEFMLIKDDQNRFHLSPAREIPFVAGTSLDVRAYLAEPVGALRVISLWNVSTPQWLELSIAPDQVEVVDFLGKPVSVEALAGGALRMAVSSRLYLRMHGNWEPWWVFRQARVRAMN